MVKINDKIFCGLICGHYICTIQTDKNMNNKHTPSPWSVNKWETHNHKGCEIIDNEESVICTLSLRSHVNDANLISAAPDMLEALIDTFEWLHNDQGYSITNPYLKAIEQAINKAKGL